MNPEGGYTRQYRRLWDNPVFRSYQEAAVFSWMKDAAQWRETTIRTKFGPVTLGIGELLMAERPTADAFGLHRNTLRSLIHRMVDEGMIEAFLDRCPQRAGTVYRIKNYEAYQGIEVGSESSEDRKRTANGTGAGPQEDRKRTKNKEENQRKEVKGGVGEGVCAPETSPELDPKPEAPANPSRVFGASSATKSIVRAFDSARAEAYGEENRRSHPSQTDHVHAQRWLESGADAELCNGVFVAICQDRAERSQAPPASLAFFDQPIADAIATRNRPMPEGKPHAHSDQRPRRETATETTARRRAGMADALARRLGSS